MKIGAYNLSSQFNMYSKLSADSIKTADESSVSKAKQINKNAEPAASLTLTGGDLYKASAKPVTYNKYNPIGVINQKPVEKLDDFSLVSAKQDQITSRLPKSNENIDYTKTVSDEQMDSFLKNAFKLLK